MKVRELKQILAQANDDAEVLVLEDGRNGEPLLTITNTIVLIEAEEE
jgi:hypothetical protein